MYKEGTDLWLRQNLVKWALYFGANIIKKVWHVNQVGTYRRNYAKSPTLENWSIKESKGQKNGGQIAVRLAGAMRVI